MTPGEQTQLLYDIRPRPRDRYGEIVDEPALHGQQPSAIGLELKAERYYRARRRADRIIPRLTDTEIEAVEDAIRAERGRRAGR